MDDNSLTAAIGANLPYLRRYARALTGSQDSGDRFAAATLEALLEDLSAMQADDNPKVALYRAFTLLWTSAGAPVGDPDSRLSAQAQAHMARLTPRSREALLLQVVEGFETGQIARILQVEAGEVVDLIEAALAEMAASVAGRVMVIEDEPIIAMDIVDIVLSVGHAVTGIARTHAEALQLAKADRPDMVPGRYPAGRQFLGDRRGERYPGLFPDTPVIFITAFPERLLTGDRPEPAFVITKPYSEEQVRSAVSQAMFFASTEDAGRLSLLGPKCQPDGPQQRLEAGSVAPGFFISFMTLREYREPPVAPCVSLPQRARRGAQQKETSDDPQDPCRRWPGRPCCHHRPCWCGRGRQGRCDHRSGRDPERKGRGLLGQHRIRPGSRHLGPPR
ncbi:MAG: response regulator [Rhodobacter sp.]|nr:response regulator [Rhodobacter sp.]